MFSVFVFFPIITYVNRKYFTFHENLDKGNLLCKVSKNSFKNCFKECRTCCKPNLLCLQTLFTLLSKKYLEKRSMSSKSYKMYQIHYRSGPYFDPKYILFVKYVSHKVRKMNLLNMLSELHQIFHTLNETFSVI